MYYTIRIFTKDGVETRNVTPYETMRDAEIRFYSCVSADMSNKDITKGLVIIIDENGAVSNVKQWKND